MAIQCVMSFHQTHFRVLVTIGWQRSVAVLGAIGVVVGIVPLFVFLSIIVMRTGLRFLGALGIFMVIVGEVLRWSEGVFCGRHCVVAPHRIRNLPPAQWYWSLPTMVALRTVTRSP